MTLDPSEPTWGFIRVFSEASSSDVNGDGSLSSRRSGAFDDPEHTSGELFTPPGSWSVHNTEVNGDHAYSSWYSHGIVALDSREPRVPHAGRSVRAADERPVRRIAGPWPAVGRGHRPRDRDRLRERHAHGALDRRTDGAGNS